MRTMLIEAVTVLGLLVAPVTAAPAAAQTGGHEGHQMAGCCADHAAMPCCAKAPSLAALDTTEGTALALSVLLPAAVPQTPVVQRAAVTFNRPVVVEGRVLLGRYVIEHDDARMARGEPCTYIYDTTTNRRVVVTFHCTHLERPAPEVATVVLRTTSDPGIQELLSFQFPGETAAHGVPNIR